MDIDVSMVACPVCGGYLVEDDGLVTCLSCDFEDDLYDDIDGDE